jgi:plasmid stabilization system protein ParE
VILRWTPQAGDDLQAVYDFIARDSPYYAQLTIEEILGAVDRLVQFPLMGRVVPEHRRDDLRELIKHLTVSFIELATAFTFSPCSGPLVSFHTSNPGPL